MQQPGRRVSALVAFTLAVLIGVAAPIAGTSVALAVSTNEGADQNSQQVATTDPATDSPAGDESTSTTGNGEAGNEVSGDSDQSTPGDGSIEETPESGGITESDPVAANPEDQAQSGNEMMLLGSTVGTPYDNPTLTAPPGQGPIPTITSMPQPGADVPSGVEREFTITYQNDGAQAITNGRFWQQYMTEVKHDTKYTVSCEASGGAVCPTEGIPAAGTAVEYSAAGGDYNNLFAFIANLPVGGKLTLTINTWTTLDEGTCAATDSPMLGTWSRYGTQGFLVPDNIVASSSTVGTITGVISPCPAGVVAMTNTVTSPGPTDNPSRVLSGDPRVFKATWKNTSSSAVTVPIKYTYYVPFTNQVTQASWTCSAAGGAACPTWGTGTREIRHDDAGEASDVVFGDATTLGGSTTGVTPDGINVTLPAGATLTFSITLTTTINTCTQDGYLRVQSYAKRGPATGETAGFIESKPSPLVLIGCSTWLMTEDFSGTTLKTPANWKGLNQACLTRAPRSGSGTGSAGTANGVLGSCRDNSGNTAGNVDRIPATNFDPETTGLPAGYLKLTDDSTDKAGAVLYDVPLPSKNGLVIEFTQYQYGNNGSTTDNLADGIGFFLSNGAYTLSQTGSSGGALGYGYRDTSQSTDPGLANAYLGLGFDAWGNFASTSHVASRCTTAMNNGISQPNQVRQSISLRGPGGIGGGVNWAGAAPPNNDNYCLIHTTALTGGKTLNFRQSSINTNKRMQTALTNSARKTRVTIYPLETGKTKQHVTVEVDFGSGYYETVVGATNDVANRLYLDDVMPDLIKFGFLGSTGGSRQANLIGDVRVGTVTPMQTLNLVKEVDRRDGTGTSQQTFKVGETVPYQFVLTNTGTAPIYQLQVVDPLINNQADASLRTIACPATTLAAGSTLICTGKYVVTEADGREAKVHNVATAQGSSQQTGDRNLSSTDDETVPIVRSVAPYSSCAADEIRASDRYWASNTTAFDFKTTGTSAPTTSNSGYSAGTGSSFVATDSKGRLQFTVDAVGGRILNRDGAVMSNGTGINVGGAGAQQVTVVPGAQGSGKYFVVTSTATASAAGQLFYTLVDMNLNAGLGGVVTSTKNLPLPSSFTGASTAVTAVPNSTGTAYWVLSPDKTGTTVRAYAFDAQGPVTTDMPVISTDNMGTAAVASGDSGFTGYEDIRFSSDFISLVAMASKQGGNTVTRMLSFDAATGTLAVRFENVLSETSSSRLGYSIEFSPTGSFVYLSRVGMGSTSSLLNRYPFTTSSLGTMTQIGNPVSSAGAVRAGANNSVYWAVNGSATMYVTNNPGAATPSLSALSLPAGATTGLGISNTLTDCAVAPSEFRIDKFNDATPQALIDGAEFGLYEYTADGKVGDLISDGVVPLKDEDGNIIPGQFSAPLVVPGDYWVRETKAPSGYQLLGEAVHIKVELHDVVSVQGTTPALIKLIASSDNDSGLYTLEMTNLKTNDGGGFQLPAAGGKNWTPLIIIVGVALLLLAVAGVLWWRKRQGQAIPVGPGNKGPLHAYVEPDGENPSFSRRGKHAK